MNVIFGLLLAFGCVGTILGHQDPLACDIEPPNINANWRSMESACINAMHDQVQMEIHASITYLAMGAYFAKDSVNRPGFSKLFFESASEEREHAIKILDYLAMRGVLTALDDQTCLVKREPGTWTNGLEALQLALELEVKVTKKIRDMIIVCDTEEKTKNDYHLVDYLTSDFLDEQYKGQRDLAGKIITLGKMLTKSTPLGEFLFDKKLLNGEI